MKRILFCLALIILLPAFIIAQYAGSITFTDQFHYTNQNGWEKDVTTLDDSTFVIAYRGGYQDTPGLAVIGTAYDTIISYSSEYTFSTGQGTLYPIRVATLDTNKVVICYNRSTPKAIIGEISGNTIIFGNEFNLKINDNMYYMDVIGLDKDHFIVGYGMDPYYANDTLTYVEYCGVSGNTIYSIDDTCLTNDNVLGLQVSSIDSTAFIFAYIKGSNGTARAGRIVDEKITLGPETEYTQIYPWYIDVTTVNDSCFVIAYEEYILRSKAIAGSVNNNNIITFGTPATFEYNRIETLYATTLGENQFILTYEDRVNFADPYGTALLGNVSGLDISFLASDIFSLYSNTSICPCSGLDDENFIVAFSDQNDWSLGFAKKGTIHLPPIQSIIPPVTACSGNISVPVLVNNLNNILEFSLSVVYDTSKMTYISYQNINNQLDIDSLSLSSDSSLINIYYKSDSPLTINSDTLLEMNFNTNNENAIELAQISWIDTISYYIDNSSDTVGSVYLDDSVTILPYPDSAGIIKGNQVVCQGDSCQIYYISSILNALQYHWNIYPGTDATLSGNDTLVEVCFNPSFFGQAILSVYGSNDCGNGDSSVLYIEVVGQPISNAGPDTTICENMPITLNGSAQNEDHTYWATFGDGTFDDRFILDATYTPGENDRINESVELVLFAFAISPCMGEIGDTITLTLAPLPDVNAGSDDSICAVDTVLLCGLAENHSSVLWTTSGDGNFDDPTLLSTTYVPGQNDINNGSVELTLSASPLEPCIDDVMDTMQLIIQSPPNKPLTPVGPTVIVLDTCSSTDYLTYNVSGATSYYWELQPDNAGIIQGLDTNATVIWNENFTGLSAYISVLAINYCGDNQSNILEVSINPVYQEQNPEGDLSITVSPNPSNGMFNISIVGYSQEIKLYVINTNGEVIHQETISSSKFSINLSDNRAGIYYLRFVCQHNSYTQKILIN